MLSTRQPERLNRANFSMMKRSIKYKLLFALVGISGIQFGLFIFSVIINVDITFLNFYKSVASLGLLVGGIASLIFSISILKEIKSTPPDS